MFSPWPRSLLDCQQNAQRPITFPNNHCHLASDHSRSGGYAILCGVYCTLSHSFYSLGGTKPCICNIYIYRDEQKSVVIISKWYSVLAFPPWALHSPSDLLKKSPANCETCLRHSEHWSSGAGCSKSENIHFAGQRSRFKPSKRDTISVLLAILIHAHSSPLAWIMVDNSQEDHTVHLGKMMRSNTKITELYLGKQRTFASRCPTGCPACWRLIQFQNFWVVYSVTHFCTHVCYLFLVVLQFWDLSLS